MTSDPFEGGARVALPFEGGARVALNFPDSPRLVLAGTWEKRGGRYYISVTREELELMLAVRREVVDVVLGDKLKAVMPTIKRTEG